ncbi:hypothetical protein DEM27_22120 [Metarhizobium album]|uniref:Uncharacterized protein n=1 Tax=Metarhizobium album TaxID=2182425 RepID=A0A2U2DL28_9HYPH|nr:hypothetical protein [Rhizobium album]PWE54017.1 hypothetical protein DEM27_22120 [Rhizobium album]
MANNVTNEGSTSGETLGTRFGHSVESQAQQQDSMKLAAPGETGETLNVYRLVPVAASTDPRWDNSPGSGELLVAARTSGDARIVAAGRELDFMDIDAAPAEDVTTVNASAFRDEKLYTVIEIERDRTDLQRGVIEGVVRVDNITPATI